MVTCERLVAALPISFRNYLKKNVFVFNRPERSKSEGLTQVHLTDLGVGKDFFRRPRGDHGTLVDDVSAATDPERLADIMVSDQHPDTALGEFADDALDIQHRERIDAGKGLIEQHEPGL